MMKLRTLGRELYAWLIVIGAVLVLRAVFVEAYVIPTGSMEQTFLVGDALLVNRFIYGVKIPVPFSGRQVPIIPGGVPQPGDIVVFKYPYENKDFVKRCVAVAGDTVRIINKILYVNNVRMDEPYTVFGDVHTYVQPAYDTALYQQLWEDARLADLFGNHVRDNFGPVIVPPYHIFVMGDNRDNSMDSRFWGPLHERYLKGKPLFIYFSFDPGAEASNFLDIFKVWQWKSVRFMRIGKVM
ncbi:MAG: signal peptidase I [candidate division WOR-3 bacterium]|nr:MAG: signal peptidase I [candidate division WOR-3 bacterium]